MSAEQLTWKRRLVSFNWTCMLGSHQRCSWLFMACASISFHLVADLFAANVVTVRVRVRAHLSYIFLLCGTAGTCSWLQALYRLTFGVASGNQPIRLCFRSICCVFVLFVGFDERIGTREWPICCLSCSLASTTEQISCRPQGSSHPVAKTPLRGTAVFAVARKCLFFLAGRLLRPHVVYS